MRVERTADGAAMMRAIEQHAARPLVDDPLAARMLSGWQAVVVAHHPLRRLFLHLLERSGPGFYGAVVCRARAVDEACRSALATGIDRVVIVGAGMDTRPYRLPEMAAARVWEFDLPAAQAAKKAALIRSLGALPGNVTYVPLDLTKPDAATVLAGAGTGRTLLICEAVTMYVDREAVDRVLAYAGRLAAGSRLIITYLPQAEADRRENDRWSRRLGWRAAYQPAELAAHLRAHGFAVLTDIGAADHQAQLLRPQGRSLAVFPGERIAVAAYVPPAAGGSTMR
ncbi:methyltransferase (TIGR00027 family) [Actinoplanes campanulatus]|uniref:S-adenosyl-L-methionine-dependent methyltransferase n=1 Tax=Actinoplanes campanulatus TaxID=113559 RepID=A0A7W5ARL9_9ACTN|nr:SAM-dependent methyltransferase [Actinoplanes campanulatus]MBB3101045.1 methyltransferase (TIGR00027 family) [Actinoplanes campanulatus]GGN49373.1 S-adenosyl-L-methionine-dependent methyltransferase [Actinoplanes campanulatus]GID41863.1 S-adenosyl-L-methionine-dependent methyltransferase [Actinoplanes campanulatus]